MNHSRIVSIQHPKSYPWPIRLFNFFGKGWIHLGISKDLKMDALLASARRQTGLEDFGEDTFREPLEKLLDSINQEARLHPFGKMITRIRLVDILKNRLRAEYWFRKHPEILEQELAPVYVITGLQRTGTTKLQRLLAADPSTRALYSWEALHPAPFLQTKPQKPDPRLAKARLSEKALRYLAPDFFAIHPVEHQLPEEEVLLLEHSFLSTVPEATLHVPSFSEWVAKQDQTPAYETLRRLLLLLQWQRSAKRWILKTPHHLEFLDILHRVFPEAKIIQTHRDPLVTLPSFCSMVYHGRKVFSDQVDAQEVGQHWFHKVHDMLSRAMEYRRQAPAACFLDVYYEDLITNPWAVIERIYDLMSADWETEIRQKMEQIQQIQTQHRYGIHQYRARDFGLNQREMQVKFAAYREQFGLNSTDKISSHDK